MRNGRLRNGRLIGAAGVRRKLCVDLPVERAFGEFEFQEALHALQKTGRWEPSGQLHDAEVVAQNLTLTLHISTLFGQDHCMLRGEVRERGASEASAVAPERFSMALPRRSRRF